MRTQAQGHIGLEKDIDQYGTGSGENSIPRINRMTPAMLVFMLAAAACGIYVGYHMTQNVFASLVFGGVFGRIGMWIGMISCSLVGGIEDFLQNIFS